MTTAADLTRYLRHRIELWIAEDPHRTAAALSRRSGLCAVHLSHIRSGKRSIGWKALQCLAAAFDTDLSSLDTAATAWALANPRPEETTPRNLCPNFTAAAARAGAEGRPPEAIEAVRPLTEGGTDRSVSEWEVRIELAEWQLSVGLEYRRARTVRLLQRSET